MKKEERRINLRLSPEEYRALDKKRFEEQTSFQEVGMGLLRGWLNGEKIPMADHPEPIEIQQARKILESGDELAINAVRMTLRLCMGNVRAPKKKAV